MPKQLPERPVSVYRHEPQEVPMRYLVQVGNQFVSYVQDMPNGQKHITLTQYKYDAADCKDMPMARKLAVILGGKAVMFDPKSGDIY